MCAFVYVLCACLYFVCVHVHVLVSCECRMCPFGGRVLLLYLYFFKHAYLTKFDFAVHHSLHVSLQRISVSTCTRAHTHTHTHTLMHMHTNVHAHTPTHSHAHFERARAHTNSHVSYKDVNTFRSHMHTRKCAYTHAPLQKNMRTQSNHL